MAQEPPRRIHTTPPGFHCFLSCIVRRLRQSPRCCAATIRMHAGENIADLTAKGHSQYIFSYLGGTFAGIFIAGAIEKTDSLTAAYCCLALTALTGVCSYAAIRTVPLSNLNSSRLQLLLEHYIAANWGAAAPRSVVLPRPYELCSADPVAPLSATPRSATFWPPITLNSPLEELFPASVDVAPRKLQLALETHAAQPHLLVRDGRQRASQLHLMLQVQATADDAIVAMLHAVCVRYAGPALTVIIHACASPAQDRFDGAGRVCAHTRCIVLAVRLYSCIRVCEMS